MKKVFLDTNVVIDLLDKREPFWSDAAALFTLAYNQKIKLYVSPLTYGTAAYLLRKHGKAELKQLLENLRRLSKVTTVSGKEVDNALASPFDVLRRRPAILFSNERTRRCNCNSEQKRFHPFQNPGIITE